jgi:membrane protease YdiL (CAAX protease family)
MGPINWKVFFVLLAASVATSLLVLPFVLAISPPLGEVFTPAVLLGAVVQSTVLFSIAIFFGLYLAKRVGLGLPVLEGAFEGRKTGGYLKSIVPLSLGMGVLAGIVVIFLSLIFWHISLTLLHVEMSVPAWKALLACFYGAIAEEILCRLFLMTLFVWICTKIRKTPQGKPTITGIWVSIVLSSVLFGLGHLPITGDLIGLSPIVVVRAVLLSGVVGIIFGRLYQKYGLESAMLSHFSCDIVLHVVVPLVASLFT